MKKSKKHIQAVKDLNKFLKKSNKKGNDGSVATPIEQDEIEPSTIEIKQEEAEEENSESQEIEQPKMNSKLVRKQKKKKQLQDLLDEVEPIIDND